MLYRGFFGLLTLLCLFPMCSMAEQKEATLGWKNLFDGTTLKGWHRIGGAARYHVEKGVVVGTAVPGTQNSFLATKQHYGDFILEFETQIHPLLNSGVQFRSHSRDDFNNGRVHGYQIEIDGSSRSWSGGIYEEGRRGWLYNLNRNPQARQAFRPSEWNHMRIEAVGTSIRTWVNGIPAAHLIDEVASEGYIALQVHSIADDVTEKNLQVRWRNIRIRTDNLSTFLTPEDEAEQISFLNNRLTRRQLNEGWELLWDGKTTAGWKGAKFSNFPEKGWDLSDGVLSVLSSGGGEARNGGDIITTQEFSNFELELDFKFSAGANSGIKYFVDPNLLKGEGSAIGLEFQILDDELHPDAKRGVSGNRTLGSLYDLITATNLSVPASAEKPIKGPGHWNRARIVVRGDHVEHWLNNTLVVNYRRGTQIFRALVAYSKYAKWKNFGEWEKGPILLQDHGDLVSFRSIKIKDFDKLRTQ